MRPGIYPGMMYIYNGYNNNNPGFKSLVQNHGLLRKNEEGDFCCFQFDCMDPQIGQAAADDDHDDDDDDVVLPVVAVDEAVGVVAHNIAGPVPLLHAASWWNLRGQLTSIEDNNEGVPDCKERAKKR